jgi:hypothetical protein
VLVKDGKAMLVRRRERLEDLLALQTEEPLETLQAALNS